MASFNLSKRALVDTVEMQLTDPESGAYLFADEDEKEPVTITLYGRSSKQHRNYMAAQLRKNELEAAKSNKKKTKSLEELMDESAEFLSALSVSSAHLCFDHEGKSIHPQTKEEFKKMYSTPNLAWIGDQVTNFVTELGNFVQK